MEPWQIFEFVAEVNKTESTGIKGIKFGKLHCAGLISDSLFCNTGNETVGSDILKPH